MECEQSLLVARRDEMPYEPASYYRWKAARARQLVDAITTQALKRRLLEEAMHYDELATAADRIAADAGFLAQPPNHDTSSQLGPTQMANAVRAGRTT